MTDNVRGGEIRRTFTVFGNLRVMIFSALLAGLSIVLGKYLPVFNIDILRFSFENLPIILAGIMFGPAVGATVGCVADLVGCVLVGYTVNPLVTVGAAAIGLTAGVVSHFVFHRFSLAQIITSVAMSHIVGSVIIKSIGLMVYYDQPLILLMLIRLGNYAIISAIEAALIYLLLRNRAVSGQLNKILRGHKKP